jgi:hypothetical protein
MWIILTVNISPELGATCKKNILSPALRCDTREEAHQRQHYQVDRTQSNQSIFFRRQWKWTTRRNVIFALSPRSDYVEGPDKHQKEETRHHDIVLNKIENYIKYIFLKIIVLQYEHFTLIRSEDLQIHIIFIFP